MTARAIEDATVLRLNIDDIRAATSDCGLAFLRLALIIEPNQPDLNIEEGRASLAPAWLYKPLQLMLRFSHLIQLICLRIAGLAVFCRSKVKDLTDSDH
jgi:hypothetical protein